VDAIILHPRTADQGFSGLSDWRLIAAMKGQSRVPVIGNGDIRQSEDAVRMLRETGCDGVMVGRGIFGNPWLVEQIAALLAGQAAPCPTLVQRMALIRRHLALAVDYEGEKKAVREFRKHLLWYTKGLRGGAQFRQLVGSIHDRQALWVALEDYFRTLGGAADE
jgi:tRNA-dihydrouridine synthase